MIIKDAFLYEKRSETLSRSWSIGNHTNTLLWQKKIQREKEVLEQKKKEETDSIREQLLQEFEKEKSPNNETGKNKPKQTIQEDRNREGFYPFRLVKEMNETNQKHMRELAKEIEEKLTVTIKNEIKANDSKELILYRIGELAKEQERRREPYGWTPPPPPKRRSEEQQPPYGYIRDPNFS